jgi:hypothetical protein
VSVSRAMPSERPCIGVVSRDSVVRCRSWSYKLNANNNDWLVGRSDLIEGSEVRTRTITRLVSELTTILLFPVAQSVPPLAHFHACTTGLSDQAILHDPLKDTPSVPLKLTLVVTNREEGCTLIRTLDPKAKLIRRRAEVGRSKLQCGTVNLPEGSVRRVRKETKA